MAEVLPFLHEDHDDDIFFRKHQLRIGTALRYYGRTKPGSLWFVTGVYTGQHIHRKETFPQKLTDLVRLKNHQTGEVRFMRFVYLEYSAIWRIDE
jgi:hypothetical protein